MVKQVIAPLVALVALGVQLVFGIEIPEEVLSEFVVSIGNAVALIIVVLGLIKQKKE